MGLVHLGWWEAPTLVCSPALPIKHAKTELVSATQTTEGTTAQVLRRLWRSPRNFLLVSKSASGRRELPNRASEAKPSKVARQKLPRVSIRDPSSLPGRCHHADRAETNRDPVPNQSLRVRPYSIAWLGTEIQTSSYRLGGKRYAWEPAASTNSPARVTSLEGPLKMRSGGLTRIIHTPEGNLPSADRAHHPAGRSPLEILSWQRASAALPLCYPEIIWKKKGESGYLAQEARCHAGTSNKTLETEGESYRDCLPTSVSRVSSYVSLRSDSFLKTHTGSKTRL